MWKGSLKKKKMLVQNKVEDDMDVYKIDEVVTVKEEKKDGKIKEKSS